MVRLTFGCDGLALEDRRDLHHIVVGGVGAASRCSTWSTLIAPISVTVLTLSGHVRAWLPAARSADRSMVYLLVVLRVRVGRQLASNPRSRPCASRNVRVTSSDGKIEVVAPSSAPMLVMVARSGTDRVLTPSPRVLDDLADAALDGHLAQNFEDDVLCGDPRPTACRSALTRTILGMVM